MPFSFYISRASRLPGTWQSINVVCVCVCVCVYVFQEGKKKREGGNIQASYTDDTHFVLLNSDSASWLSHLNQLLCFVLLYTFLKRKALWSLQAR